MGFSLPKIGGSIGNAIGAIPILGSPISGYNGLADGGIAGAGKGIVSNISGQNAYDAISPPPGQPSAPGQDPTLAAVKGQQVADANSFRQNLPNTQQNLYEGAYKSERQNLAKNLQGVRNNANQRGLLYSGIEQGSELGQRNNSAANLEQARTEINNSTNDQANQMDANAVQSGIMQQQSIATIQDQTMSQALANMAARRATYSGIGQGVGAAAGTYMANQNAQRYNPNSTSYGVGQPTTYGT